MKKRISVTIEPKLDKLMDKVVEKGDYRNKSHLVERAIKKILEEEK